MRIAYRDSALLIPPYPSTVPTMECVRVDSYAAHVQIVKPVPGPVVLVAALAAGWLIADGIRILDQGRRS